MAKENKLMLKAVGDIAFFDSLFSQNQIEDFETVVQQLNSGDVLFGNFEFPYTQKKIPNFVNSYPGYIASPESIELLKKIKFHVLNIATNHIMDWGEEGLVTTRDILKNFQFEPIGAGLNLELARHPAIIECNQIRLGFLGYAKKGHWNANDNNPGTAILDLDCIQEDVVRIKKNVDHVIVSLHWGTEFSNYPAPEDINLAHQIIDSGVSIILGHHPHVLQGVENYKNGIICYSLGNFFYDPSCEKIFVPNKLAERLETGIFTFEISKTSIEHFHFIPYRINRERIPEILKDSEAETLIQKLGTYSKYLHEEKYYYSDVGNSLLRREILTYLKLLKNPVRGINFIRKNVKLKHLKLIKNILLTAFNSFKRHKSES